MVSYNQGILKGFDQKEEAGSSDGSSYNLLIVTLNSALTQALKATLEHFLLNRRKINVTQVKTINEALNFMESRAETVLVVVDDMVHLNGSYAAFTDYVRNSLNNRKCAIILKGDLIHSKNIEWEKSLYDETEPGFQEAHARLVEITRMIILTSEMEKKIGHSALENNPVHLFDHTLAPTSHREEEMAKESIYSVMAHNLKGPVVNIRVMLDFLTNEPELLDQETSKDLLLRVKESANNVHDLLEDFLYWSKMISKDIHFNPGKIDLENAVRSNLNLVRSLATSKNISLNLDSPGEAWVFADEYMLHTILRNLLYNAIKFTENGGDIDVRIEKLNGEHRVTIYDTGAGIPADKLEIMFDNKKSISTRGVMKEKGVGLGLMICREFIEKNGGMIHIESISGLGNSFIFTLPSCNKIAC